MRPRALAPIVLCAAAIWPLCALACINSMEREAIAALNQPLWVDLLAWTAGAVFLNVVVVENLREPLAPEQPRPSWFRRSFFLLAGVCLVLLLTIVMAGGPLLSLSAAHMAMCSFMSPSLLLTMVTGPAMLFVLQALIVQKARKRSLVRRRGAFLVMLVVSSLFLAAGVSVIRDSEIIPALCPISGREYI